MNVHARNIRTLAPKTVWRLLTPYRRLELIHQPWAELHAKQKDSA